MEPMVLYAIGLVAYIGCETVKDFIADLRQDGFDPGALPGPGLWAGLKRIFERLLGEDESAACRQAEVSFLFMCSRGELPRGGGLYDPVYRGARARAVR